MEREHVEFGERVLAKPFLKRYIPAFCRTQLRLEHRDQATRACLAG
jgi:hypothetical protein